MKVFKLTDTEAKFAEIIWSNNPIQSGDLVKICENELNWKKSTTYTMLKRLEKKGVFRNENGIVSALISKDEFHSEQSKQFVRETYDGSLPRFVAAFTKGEKLSKDEISELQTLIDGYKEG
jgi:predicted transcriptional regulator